MKKKNNGSQGDFSDHIIRNFILCFVISGVVFSFLWIAFVRNFVWAYFDPNIFYDSHGDMTWPGGVLYLTSGITFLTIFCVTHFFLTKVGKEKRPRDEES